MKAALFDLDGTLLRGDTDVMWGEVLTAHGVFDPATSVEFERAYSSGELDAEGFVARFLSPIAEHGQEACERWLKETLEERVFPQLSQSMLEVLEDHRERGHELVLATATNEFLVRPIAAHLNIPWVLASPAEEVQGRYTGLPSGPACFRQEKLRRARRWLEERGQSLTSSELWFYSDSRHDLPLLEAVQHPCAVDPDEELATIAQERAWPIISR